MITLYFILAGGMILCSIVGFIRLYQGYQENESFGMRLFSMLVGIVWY